MYPLRYCIHPSHDCLQYVFLVGGFSESPYMYKRIKEFIEVKKDIQVIKPSYA
jgi:hypothetical protein